MKVNCYYRNDPERKLTDPLPELGGRKFIFRLYSGKLYGADPEAYKNWMPKEDVYPGSQAVCFSLRPFATIK